MNSQNFKRRSKRRVCHFTMNKIELIDYKDTKTLSRFVTDRGKIVPKRNSGLCAKWQRKVAVAIKRARFMGLLPYSVEF
ncbi:MAG: 30S ribosomal protein S18 [Rickettsiales bacterium]|nr:30S ribosomal protein S18 [Rickettsiales bacterium]|tara:strand:+ start:1295 stop:1531 length:237 start_codon:yes stop_codon:yes gene_type:complete